MRECGRQHHFVCKIYIHIFMLCPRNPKTRRVHHDETPWAYHFSRKCNVREKEMLGGFNETREDRQTDSKENV